MRSFYGITLIILLLALTLNDSFAARIRQRRANGCGPQGGPNFDLLARLLGTAKFINCCNGHDNCYERCGSSKLTCDKNFAGCLTTACGLLSTVTKPTCLSTAAIFSGAVIAAGQNAFNNAQRPCKG